MFENQIRHAREIIERHERTSKIGWNDVESSAKVSVDEGQTWLTETTRLVEKVFGKDSEEAASWHELLKKRREAFSQHIAERPERPTAKFDLEYHIHNYLSYIALLTQLDTRIDAAKIMSTQSKQDQPALPAKAPPVTLGTAFVQAIWSLPAIFRYLLLTLAGLFFLLFAVWRSLPDKAKEAVLQVLTRHLH